MQQKQWPTSSRIDLFFIELDNIELGPQNAGQVQPTHALPHITKVGAGCPTRYSSPPGPPAAGSAAAGTTGARGGAAVAVVVCAAAEAAVGATAEAAVGAAVVAALKARSRLVRLL